MSLVVLGQTAYVRGYVVDEANHGLEFVRVTTIGSSQRTTSTNAKGYYELQINPLVDDTIAFFLVGYKEVFRLVPEDVVIAANINVVLLRDTTALAEVGVSELKRNRGTMTEVDTKLIRLTPDAAGGIESIVKTQLGVNSSNELSSQYSVRGGSYDENSVYVNSVEIYRPLLVRASQQEGLSFINPDMVEKVNFSAGGFPVKYGDKMSSVLDIQYKTPEKFEANVTAGFMGLSGYLGYGNGKFSMTHGVRYKTNQYLIADKIKLKNGKSLFKGLDTKGDFNNYFIDYQTQINYKFSPKLYLSFLGNISQNNYEFAPKSQQVQFGTSTIQREFYVDFSGNEKDKFTTYFGALTFGYKPREEVDMKFILSGYNSSERESYDLVGAYSISDVKYNNTGDRQTDLLGSGVFHEHSRNRLSATVLNLMHAGSSKLWRTVVEWGVGLSREIVSERVHEYERRDSAQYSLPHTGDEIKMLYNLTANNYVASTRLQAYLQQSYEWKVWNALWNVNVGVRTNYWSFNNEWLLSPRMHITCTPLSNRNLVFRMAAGIYYQSPFYKEIKRTGIEENGDSFIALNKNIKAQRSGHLLLGMDYFFRLWRRPFKLTSEVYYKPADRIIPYSVDNVKITYAGENQAVGYTTGIDLKLFGEFVPGVDSWISLSYMRSREDLVMVGGDMSGDHYENYTNKGTYLGEVYPGYIPRPNEQRYSVSIFFQDYIPNHPEYKISLKLVWADGLPFGPPRSERYKAVFRTKPYRRVDLGASRSFVLGRDRLLSRQSVVKALTFNLDLLNLFNIQNESSYYWVSDISGYQWAVPNHLTNFMLNFRVSVDF